MQSAGLKAKNSLLYIIKESESQSFVKYPSFDQVEPCESSHVSGIGYYRLSTGDLGLWKLWLTTLLLSSRCEETRVRCSKNKGLTWLACPGLSVLKLAATAPWLIVNVWVLGFVTSTIDLPSWSWFIAEVTMRAEFRGTARVASVIPQEVSISVAATVGSIICWNGSTTTIWRDFISTAPYLIFSWCGLSCTDKCGKWRRFLLRSSFTEFFWKSVFP